MVSSVAQADEAFITVGTLVGLFPDVSPDVNLQFRHNRLPQNVTVTKFTFFPLSTFINILF